MRDQTGKTQDSQTTDDGRRRVLKAITFGGAAMLLPHAARAEEPPAFDPPGELAPPEGSGPVMATRAGFKTTRGTADRIATKRRPAPAVDANGVRFTLEVHRAGTDGKDVYVQWGSGATSAGGHGLVTTSKVGAPPNAPATANGKTTFTVQVQVEIDAAGNVSVIVPGGDPH